MAACGLAVLVAMVWVLLAGADRAAAAPVPAPTPSPSAPVAGGACAAKAPGQVAWCMSWAVHVDTPPSGARSHWVTDCSQATDASEQRECAAASVTLDPTPETGTASVLMDGPSTNGLAALVNCALLTGPDIDHSGQPSLWTPKQTACSANAARWAAQSYDPHPTVACGAIDVPCQVSKGAQEAVGAGIRSGIEGLIDLCVQGTVVLLSKLAEFVFTTTAIAAPDEAFYSTYNSVAGVLILGSRRSAGPWRIRRSCARR